MHLFTQYYAYKCLQDYSAVFVFLPDSWGARPQARSKWGEPAELFLPSKWTKSAFWEYFGYRKKSDGYGLEGRLMYKMCLRAEAADEAIHQIRVHLREHLLTTLLPSQESSTITADQEQGTSTSTTVATKKTNLWGKKQKHLISKTSRSRRWRCLPERKWKMEIKQYLSCAPISSDADPLAWWTTHVEELPLLSTAKKFLCIPARAGR